MTKDTCDQAIVLFAHGARDPAWRKPFDAIAAAVKQRAPSAIVEIAFLELMEPKLPQVVANLFEQGRKQLLVIPVFLSQSGHVMRDLPQIISQCIAAHPGLIIELGSAIGEEPTVIKAIAEACLERAQTKR